MRWFRIFWVVLLAGCASAPAPLPTTTLAFRPVSTHFELSGRLAARNGEEALHGKFAWRHAPEQDQWDFFSPLGQVVARVSRDGADAALVTADGSRIDEPFDVLVARVLGMPVPVVALPRWVQAGVVAGEDVRELDALGRPLKLIDSGWQVRYLAYESERADARPSSIEVSRGEARLKLVIDAWQ
jgi:outer membrane lipoprotein LolB